MQAERAVLEIGAAEWLVYKIKGTEKEELCLIKNFYTRERRDYALNAENHTTRCTGEPTKF